MPKWRNELEDGPGSGNGAFSRNSRTRFAELTDGLGGTLLAGERGRRDSRATWVGAVTRADEAPSLVLGDTGTPPNSADADEDDFSSRGAQGANFQFADGSVRPIRDSIDPAVWIALAPRAGGEIISASDFRGGAARGRIVPEGPVGRGGRRRDAQPGRKSVARRGGRPGPSVRCRPRRPAGLAERGFLLGATRIALSLASLKAPAVRAAGGFAQVTRVDAAALGIDRALTG